jgi:hypothetical protein
VFEDLDELARGLAENDVSRQQAIKWAGYSVLGAALSSMGFADTAEALTRRGRRRCRRRGGTPLEEGNCHCAANCRSKSIPCHGTESCTCFKTTENTGFCLYLGTGSCNTTCTSSKDCPSGSRCVVHSCCGQPVCVDPCPTVHLR